MVGERLTVLLTALDGMPAQEDSQSRSTELSSADRSSERNSLGRATRQHWPGGVLAVPDPTGVGAGARHAGSPLRLLGVCSRVAMRSRYSGVSGGNESTTARTYSGRTVAGRSGVAGSVMLGGSPCAVRTGCLREGSSDLGGSVVSISGAVAVGRACSALLRVLVVLSRCCEWFGLSVRYFSFPQDN